MRTLTVFALLAMVLGGTAWAADVIVPADMSCRTEGFGYADTNRHDSSKLSVRASSNGNKSWTKFDQLAEYDLGTLRAASLTVFLHEGKGGSQQCDVSAVNDDVLDNINWVDHPSQAVPEQGIYALTWNNAPGNLISDLGLLDPAKTTLIDTLRFTDGQAGQGFEIDVLDILLADTDGIVQFVLHNAPNLLNFATHDHPDPAKRPYLTLAFPPEGADFPIPEDGAEVETALAQLAWTNPEPNTPGQPIYCDVYLGTEPNRPAMDRVPVGPDISAVAINTANFPNFGVLLNRVTYYWVVDCYDTDKGLIEGEFWSFYTNNNEAPLVDAGDDSVVWLTMGPEPGQITMTLSGVISDDGRPEPYTVQWTQVDNGAPAVDIVNADQEVATVTLTERGVYVFMLTADDGDKQTSDTVEIIVGDTPCDASHLSTADPYHPADVNQDRLVDLADFVLLFADEWLTCTDELTYCGVPLPM